MSFIVRSRSNPDHILCTNGEWHPEAFVGSGQPFTARIHRTRAIAGKWGAWGIVCEAPPQVERVPCSPARRREWRAWRKANTLTPEQIEASFAEYKRVGHGYNVWVS